MPKRMPFGIALVLVMTAPAHGAAHAVLPFKPGLWEFTDTPKVTGDTVISDTMTAKMTAAQRAQFLVETRKMMAQPQTVRECMTPAKFDQRLFSADGAGCTQTIVSNAASRIEVQTKCRDGRQGTDRSVVASNPISVTITMHAVVAQHGKTMTVDTAENGRWLGADCGGLKDIQVMP